jgi:uncharacterized membrane protein YccC
MAEMMLWDAVQIGAVSIGALLAIVSAFLLIHGWRP